MKKLLIATAALFAVLNLSGCMLVIGGGGGYHDDHGDLVSGDGTVRYMGWCSLHVHNSHCEEPQPTAITIAAANIGAPN